MYICEKCKRTFTDPATVYDDIGYKYSVCPYCGDDRISETEPCKQCGEPKQRDHEDYCEECKSVVIAELLEFVHGMVEDSWDRELVMEMMEEYLRED
jgi:DNA-directed RNA polymerase subunit RPC12/RpoP